MADVTVADVDATWVNPAAVQYDAGEVRRADAAGFLTAGIVRGVEGGLVLSVDADDQVTVDSGSVVIPGNASAGTGVYRAGLAAAVSAQLAPRDATYGRLDRVIFRQLDTDVVPSHGAYTARVEVLTGEPAAVPVAKSLPKMAVNLGVVSVPVEGGAAASVDGSRRTFATAPGGIITVSAPALLGESDLLAVPVFSRAVTLNDGVEWEFDGSGWRVYRPFAALYGNTQVPALNNATDTILTFGALQASTPAGFGDPANNRLVAPRAGWYRVQASAEFSQTTTGVLTLQLLVNGVQNRMARGPSYAGTNKCPVHLEALVNLSEGDALTINARQTSGGVLGVTEKYLTAEYVRA